MPTPAQTARLAEAIAADFYGEGDELKLPDSARDAPRKWDEMPEVKAVKQLRESGADDRTVRLFLTFVAAMTRSREFAPLLCAALKLFSECPDLYEPAVVTNLSERELKAFLSEVTRKHGSEVAAWHRIARSLSDGGALAATIDTGRGNAVEMIRDLGSTDGEGNRFPLLRGAKIGPLVVGWLAAPGGARVENLDLVPIPVDVHIYRVSQNLGVGETHGWPDDIAKPAIQRAWHEAASKVTTEVPENIRGTCAALDAPLWVIGKHGCKNCGKQGRRIPVSRACESCRFQP